MFERHYVARLKEIPALIYSSKALWALAPRFQAAIVGVLLVLAGGLVLLHVRYLLAFFSESYWDFGRLYQSSRAFWYGCDIYAPCSLAQTFPASEIADHFLNLNAPHTLIPILPLAFLPPQLAGVLWLLASILSLWVALRLIAREVRIEWNRMRIALAAVAALVFASTGAVLLTGQITWLLLVPVTFAWRAARRGRWREMGIWLGLVVSLKGFFLIFVPYLILRRHWDALVMFLIATILSFGTGLLVFGSKPYIAWLKALGQIDWQWLPMNASVLGILSRYLQVNPMLEPAINAPWLVQPIWLLASVLIGGLTLFLTALKPTLPDHDLALLMLAALLISPLGWIYYHWLIVGPGAAVLITRPRARFVAASAGFACPLILVLNQPNSLAPLLGSIYGWSTLALWVALLYERLKLSQSH